MNMSIGSDLSSRIIFETAIKIAPPAPTKERSVSIQPRFPFLRSSHPTREQDVRESFSRLNFRVFRPNEIVGNGREEAAFVFRFARRRAE